MKSVYMVLICLLCGCAATTPPVIPPGPEAGHQGGTYQKPIVEYILIPATIRGGIYIPEHYEYVTVKPGGYIVLDNGKGNSATPPSDDPKAVEMQPKAKIISPSNGDDITVVVYKAPVEQGRAAILQNKISKYLFKNAIAYYRLYEKEPVRIGQAVYAFSVTGQSFNIYTVEKNTVISKSLHADESYITPDGYILSPNNKGGR